MSILGELSPSVLNGRKSPRLSAKNTPKSPSKPKSPATRRTSSRKSPSRRETADPIDMAKLLSQMQQEHGSSAATSTTNSPLLQENNENMDRRQTADPADLADLLNEMQNASGVSSTSDMDKSQATPSSTNTSAAATPTNATSMSIFDHDQSSAGIELDLNNSRRMTSDTLELADMLKEAQAMQNKEEEEEDNSILAGIQAPPSAKKGTPKSPKNKVKQNTKPVIASSNPYDCLYEDSVYESRRSSFESEASMNNSSMISDTSAMGLVDMMNKDMNDSNTTNVSDATNASLNMSTMSTRSSAEADHRRQTADPMDLVSLLKNMEETNASIDVSPLVDKSELKSSPKKDEFTAPLPVSTLKSCMSTTKKVKHAKNPSIAICSHNKSVVFGSPNVAEFNKLSPSVSMTPLHKSAAKQMFPIPSDAEFEEAEKLAAAQEDEETSENSRILENWERLTNASSTGSSDDEDSLDGMTDVDMTEGMTVELEDNMMEMVNNQPASVTAVKVSEETEITPKSKSASNCRRSSRSSSRRSSISTSSKKSGGVRNSLLEEETDDYTVELEPNLEGLLQNVQNQSPARPSVPSSNRNSISVIQTDGMEENEVTVELEPNLMHILQQDQDATYKETAADVTNEDVTVELESNLMDVVNAAKAPLTPASPVSSVASKRRSSRKLSVSSSHSNPKSARRRKSMIQSPMDASDFEEETEETGLAGHLGASFHTNAVNMSSANTSATDISSVSTKSSAALLSELREGDSPNMSTASSNVSIELGQYAGYEDVDDEVSVKMNRSGTHSGSTSSNVSMNQISINSCNGAISNVTTPSTSTCVDADAETVPKKPMNTSVSTEGNASLMSLTPSGLNDISQISSNISANSSRLSRESIQSVGGEGLELNNTNIVVSEQCDLHGNEIVPEDVVEKSVVEVAEESAAVEEVDVNISGFGPSKQEQEEADLNSSMESVNQSVIGPLTFNTNTATNRYSLMPGANPNPNGAVDSATARVNDLLKKVQGLNDNARRNSLAQLGDNTANMFHHANAATARYSIASANTRNSLAGSNKGLKRSRYSLFPSFASKTVPIKSEPDGAEKSFVQEDSTQTENVENFEDEVNTSTNSRCVRQRMEEVSDYAVEQQKLSNSSIEKQDMSTNEAETKVEEDAVSVVTPAPVEVAPVVMEVEAAPVETPVTTAVLPVVDVSSAPAAPSEVVEAVVNNLSYCHVTKLTASKIEVTIVLSTYINGSISFDLEKAVNGGNKSSSMLIGNMEVQLANISTEKSALFELENKLACTYFQTIMCANKYNGPLSEVYLTNHVACAADIPSLLNMITGYVVTFRRLLNNLTNLEHYKWDVTENGIITLTPKGNGSSSKLSLTSIPLPILISNQCDVEACI